MAMSVGSGGEDEPMMEINTTPLIDVMLVLLIMFIITLPVMTHAVKLDMPQARNNPPPDVVVEPIRLDIDWDGAIIWNGTQVQLSQLENYFRVEAAKNPQPELHVRPDRRDRIHRERENRVLGCRRTPLRDGPGGVRVDREPESDHLAVLVRARPREVNPEGRGIGFDGTGGQLRFGIGRRMLYWARLFRAPGAQDESEESHGDPLKER